MARLPRLFVPGYPTLIQQRGNNHSQIFTDDLDHQRYLDILRDCARELAIPVHAYVQMADHVHLLVSCSEAAQAGLLMQRLGRQYVRQFNNRHGRSGTLWEGRFRSTVLEPSQFLIDCYAYLDLNPQRSGLVQDAAHYPWSSCRHHLGLVRDPLIADHPLYWALGNTPFDRQAAYRRVLDQGLGERTVAQIRQAACHGWILGAAPAPHSGLSPNRREAPLPKGRPRQVRGE